MLTWHEANKVAHLATARAHAELGVDLAIPRVDVVRAISRAGIELVWRPMPRVFGLYFKEPGATIGILVNTGLDIGAQRHTAAHELGHHWLGHTTSVDDGSTIDIGAGAVDMLPTKREPRRWTDQEKTAEAFAAFFLMPRRVVQAALGRIGVLRPESAVDVYRLSVLLGTSYATTLRHLPNLRILSTRDASQWAKVPPGRLKSRLDKGVPAPADRRRQVAVVTIGSADAPVHLDSGDRLVLPCVRASDITAPSWLHVAGETAGAQLGDGVVLDVADLRESATGHLQVSEGRPWEVTIHAGPRASGRQ